ncbi:ATP-binding response regulator [Dubosiella newyorkensis]|uniref:ATP-binding response regulator n=2 Tax=Dubosiella newyorkensis TaxID=1862672 RepID=UPI0025726836|nr:ATP-binding protein [Dubosiella newyorkensis]
MEVEVDYWTSIDDKPTCVRQSFIMSKDEETNEIMAMVVFRNITELVWEKRKQTQALQEALLQARQANFAKTTFLSNMSHDIRTPMNAIIGFSNIALNHIENKEQVRASLEKILSSSQHLLGLINDILDMSQIESGKLQIQDQVCDLSQLIYDLLNIVQPQIYKKKMSFHLDVHGVQDVRVSTDPLKLNQVLINILGNALKYTPAGGSIDMKVEQLPGQENHKTWYRFVVKDNGIGMSSEFVAKIFEPFERASSATISGIQGAGLGMPITKNIIEAMHGKIEVESELGKGSVFTVMLPLKIVRGDRGEVLDLVHEKIVLLDSDLEERTQLFEQFKAWNGMVEIASNIEDLYRRGERAVCLVDRDHFERMDVSKLLAPRLVVISEWDHGNRTFESIDGLPVYFVSRPLFVAHVYPLLYEEDHALIPEDKKLASVSFEGLRLLLVEDNELNREIAQIVLEEAGFVVECAPDGVDAIEMVQASANRYYDGILMDVQMPLMNGYEATMAIRRLDRKDAKRMPIIAMTANAMEDDIKDSIAAGMDAHISKPIDVVKLMETLSKFFGGQMK